MTGNAMEYAVALDALVAGGLGLALQPPLFAGTCCGEVFGHHRRDEWVEHQRTAHNRRAPGSSRWVFPQVPRKLDKTEVAWLGHAVAFADEQLGTFYVWAIAPGERLWLIDQAAGVLLADPVPTWQCRHVSSGVLYPEILDNLRDSEPSPTYVQPGEDQP